MENRELRCRLGLDALKMEPECESTVSARSPRPGRVRRCRSLRSPWAEWSCQERLCAEQALCAVRNGGRVRGCALCLVVR